MRQLWIVIFIVAAIGLAYDGLQYWGFAQMFWLVSSVAMATYLIFTDPEGGKEP